MKIALVTADDLTQNLRVRLEARALAAAGHRVTVFGVLSPSTEEEEDEAGVVYVRVPLKGWKAHGGGLRRPVRLALWYERFRPLVTAAVARETPEAIHACDLDVALPAQDAALALGIPFVHDVAGAAYVDRLADVIAPSTRGAGRAAYQGALDILRRKGSALETKLRRRGVAATVADSESLADDLARRYGGAPPAVVRTIPPYRAPVRSNALRRRVGAFVTDRVLLFFGPLADGCGADTAIRSLRLLGEGHVLAFLGCTPRLTKYERIADAEGVAGQVRFIPEAPEAETMRLAASADVALVPTEPVSPQHRFGIPPRFWSSLAAGLPVVASATGDVGAIVRETGAGVLYTARSPQDPAALAEGIHTLLHDGPLARTCAEAAVRAHRESLNWERESTRLVDLYDAVEQNR
jgi:glycosyltransferase involved in cell wall biosynthesis